MNFPSTSANTVNNIDASGYEFITSLIQLPDFNLVPSLLSWTPCAIKTYSQYPPHMINNDKYKNDIVEYFLNTKVILSTELCETISVCDPLWVAITIANKVKILSNTQYNNIYIQPVIPFDETAHDQYHTIQNKTT
jgi:hypothetical protein